jgi:IS5 family transposase
MKQTSLGLGASAKRTLARVLDEMERVVRWADMVSLCRRTSRKANVAAPPFPVESLLRIHFVQQWFTLSDLSMK